MANQSNIQETFERYSSCSETTQFLQNIIERSSPDDFHWSDIEEASTIYEANKKMARVSAWLGL